MKKVILLLLVSVGTAWAGPSDNDKALTPADLTYLGAFRLPRSTDFFDYAGDYGHGAEIAYNPANNSLFIAGQQEAYPGRVMEINIPTPSTSTSISALPVATQRQAAHSITTLGGVEQRDKLGVNGATSSAACGGWNGVMLGGLLVSGSTLYGNVYPYYDACNDGTRSHFSHSTTLTTDNFAGLYKIGSEPTGYVAGYMGTVPTSWRAALGGDTITGQAGIPIISRESAGPSIYTFNLSSLTGSASDTPKASNKLAISDKTHGPGAYDDTWTGGSLSYWNGADECRGVVFPDGSKTVLVFGRHGNNFCYGTGTANPALNGQPTGLGDVYCYDPTDSSHGTHTYPISPSIWAFAATDLAEVKAGTRQPYQAVATRYNFPLPFTRDDGRINGAAYDETNKIIYLTAHGVDDTSYASAPIVYAYQVNVTGGSTPPTSTQGVTIRANKFRAAVRP